MVLYQPQPEKLEGNILKGRAAVSVEMNDRDQPVFGAIWFSAELRIDRSDRAAYMVGLDVDNIRIPEEEQDKAGALAALLEREIPKLNIPISMDNLLATLEVVDAPPLTGVRQLRRWRCRIGSGPAVVSGGCPVETRESGRHNRKPWPWQTLP